MNRDPQRDVRERAFALWEAHGRPEGREVEHWLRAERELANPSGGDAGRAPAAPDEPLRRSVREAVPAAERLPTAAAENPLSQRVVEAGTEPKPSRRRSTFKGGDQVEG